MLRTNSIVEVVRRLAKLLLRSLDVALRCVQILVSEDLSQTHQIVVVGQELVSHRVSKQMRINLEATNGAVFVAQCSNASFPEPASFPDEDGA